MAEIRIVEGAVPPQVVLYNALGETPLPALWLRTRSPDPSQRDALTRQRLTNTHRLPTDLQITAAHWAASGQLSVAFSDGFAGLFDPAELLASVELTEGCPAPIPWNMATAPNPVYQWPDISGEGMSKDAPNETLYRAVKDFIELGFILIHNTPTRLDSVLQVAGRFGFVRSTNFGTLFEVYSRPNPADATDLSYQAVALGPHTDNPYRTPVPGVQLLQCLQNETSGGLSTLVDSLAVAAQLQSEDPAGFALLAKVPVHYDYRDATTHLEAVKPMIEANGSGQMTGVHYSPRLDNIPLMSEADTRTYHAARMRLSELFEDPRFELKFRLQPGQLMMFDNNRVLHGRTAYNPAEGHRQLQGCYIDRDGPRSLYRVLHRTYGTKAAPVLEVRETAQVAEAIA